MSPAKVIFLLVWSVSTGYMAYDLSRGAEGRDVAEEDQIGVFEVVKGTVQIKPDARIIWRRAFSGQKIAFNDSISTGPDGSATLVIGGGKPISLGPGSVITLRPEKKGSQDDIRIDLSRGFLETKNDLKAPKNSNEIRKNITIKAGESTFALKGHSSEISLFKDKKEDKIEILKTKGSVTLQKGPSMDAITLGSIETKVNRKLALNQPKLDSKFDIEVTPKNKLDLSGLMLQAHANEKAAIELRKKQQERELAEKREKEKKERELEAQKRRELEKKKEIRRQMQLMAQVNPEMVLPQIVSPPSGAIGWYIGNGALRNINVPLTISIKNSPPKDFKWEPYIEQGDTKVGGVTTQFLKRWPTRAEAGMQSLLTQPGISLQEKPSGPVQFSFEPAATLTSTFGNGSSETKKGAPVYLTVKELSQLSGPVFMVLNKVEFSETASMVRWQGGGGGSRLYLRSPRALKALTGLMKSGSFRLESGSFPGGVGVYFIKNGEITAGLFGPFGSEQNLIEIKNRLGASVVFRGMETDYIGGSAALTALLPTFKGNRIYVVTGGRFVSVRLNFIKKNESVRKFLEGGDALFFRKQVRPYGLSVY